MCVNHIPKLFYIYINICVCVIYIYIIQNITKCILYIVIYNKYNIICEYAILCKLIFRHFKKIFRKLWYNINNMINHWKYLLYKRQYSFHYNISANRYFKKYANIIVTQNSIDACKITEIDCRNVGFFISYKKSKSPRKNKLIYNIKTYFIQCFFVCLF